MTSGDRNTRSWYYNVLLQPRKICGIITTRGIGVIFAEERRKHICSNGYTFPICILT